jgi:enediyne biosynthesis protein E4
MSDPMERPEPREEPAPPSAAPAAGDGIEEPVDPEDFVAADDRIIGKAFRWSLVVIGAVAAVALVAVYLANRPQAAPPVQAIEAAAPEAVHHPVSAPAIPFADVTRQAGIRFVHDNGAYGEKLLPETMGSGVAFFDLDGDGDQDLLFVNSAPWAFAPPGSYRPGPAPIQALYENDGSGRFTDITRRAGLDLSFYGTGVAVGDYDGDGRPDLFLTAVGPNHLLHNVGGRFEEVTAKAGVAGREGEWSTGAAFFDYDNDGDLDLFVANYVRWSRQIDLELDFRLTGVGRAYGPPQNFEGTYPYLYRNDGDGTFTDVSAQAGIQVNNPAPPNAPMAKSLGLLPIDADGDGWMDLLVANDTVRKFFFHNKGDGTFEEQGEFFGLAYDRDGNATGAMGVDAAYVRNDHNLGILISNFANEMTSVYVAQDDPSFYVDEAIGMGIGAPSRLALSFGLFLFDADLDGRLDVLQANGHLEDEINKVDPSQHYRQPAQLFWNAGPDAERGFIQVPAKDTGDLGRPIVGRSTAYADVDGDGDLDVVITQAADSPVLLRNDQALGHHWLRVKLVAPPPNRDAIGAWVELTAGGVTQRREVMPTRSYLAQVELPITFGLADATRVDALTVTWPDGTKQDVPVEGVDRLQVVRREG